MRLNETVSEARVENATAIPRATSSLLSAIDQAREIKMTTEALADRLFGCLEEGDGSDDCGAESYGEIGALEQAIGELKRQIRDARIQISRLEDLA